MAPFGVSDRCRLATPVFASDEVRQWLEQTLWPRVRARVAAWREQQSSIVPPPRVLVVEVPLLFEGGGERMYDATITVTADEQLRHERAGARGQQALAQREQRQLSQEQKAARATFVVANDGSIEELEAKLSDVLAKLGA